MKIRNIFALTLASALAFCSCAEQDMTKVDEWLGEKFNQEILWDVDSLAFRRTEWESVDVAGGLQVRKSAIKMWGSVQSITYVTYSPNMFNTYLGYTGQEAATGDIASGYEGAMFAVNAGALSSGKPENFFKLDGEIINPTASEGSDAILGLTTSPLGVSMKVSANVESHDSYTSAMVTGPLILRNGKEIDFSEETDEFYTARMARTIVGVASTGNYTLAVIDGGVAGEADGATAQEAAYIARMMGLDFAALLGCGDDATAWAPEEGVLNAPSSGVATKVGSVIYLGAGTSRVEGDGTEESPYLIENHVHMTQMRALCTPGSTKYFQMIEDVDMSEVKTWTPVNFDGDFSRQVHFDGNGKTISNFSPEQFVADDQTTAAAYASIFGVLYGSCKDLTVKDSKILMPLTTGSATGIIGGFVGTKDLAAVLENVHVVDCEVSGGRDVGLFGGQARDASLKGCTASGKVTGGAADAGGFIGRAAGIMSFEDCHSDVYLTPGQSPGSNFRYGGLVGFMATIGGTDLERDKLYVTGCSSTGTIFNDQYSGQTAAGLVAYINSPVAEVRSSYTTMNFDGGRTAHDGQGGNLACCGGVAGIISTAGTCVIKDCYSTSEHQFIVGQKSGGMVGTVEKGTVKISDCYSTYVMNGYSGLGAIVGISTANGVLELDRCFAWTPSITAFRESGDKYSSGAIVGCALGASNNISNCFRHPALVFTDAFRTMKVHGDLADGKPANDDEGGTNTKGTANQNAFDAQPSAEATLTAAAKKAGWSESVWDFSGDVPVLK